MTAAGDRPHPSTPPHAAVGVHLLGGGDLGVGADRAHQQQQLAEFAAADHGRRLDMLAHGRQDAPGGPGRPPIANLLAVPRYAIDRLVVVATRQDPRDPRDTYDIGAFLAGLDAADHQRLWGQPVTVDLVTVSQVSLHAVRQQLRDHLRPLVTARDAPTRAILGPGGMVTAFVGMMLGVAEAGIRPRVWEAADGRVESHDLAVAHDPVLWLVRLGLFDAVEHKARTADESSLADPAPRSAADWALLDALHRLDWPEARTRREHATDTAQAYVEVPDPVGATDEPRDELTWEWLRHVLQSALARRAARGDAGALALARPWIEARTGELVLRADPDPPADQPDTRPGRLAATYLDGADDAFIDAVGQQPRFATAKTFLDAAGPLWREAGPASHGTAPANQTMAAGTRRHLRQALEGAPGDDPTTLVLHSWRFPRWPLVPTDDVVVVHAVGWSNLPDGAASSPMLDALAGGLPDCGLPLQRCHLWLAASHDTAGVARQLVPLAYQAGFASCTVIADLPVGDYRRIQLDVYDQLAATVAHSGEVVVFTGPGGKALNCGVITAAAQAAFDALRPVWVGSLREDPAGGGTRVDLDRSPASRVLARFAHDPTLAQVVPVLLDRVDIGSLRHVLATASPAWEPIDARLGQLEALLFGDLGVLADRAGELAAAGDLDRAGLSPHGLWAARAQLFRRVADVDPWRGLALIVACARAAWGHQWPDLPGHEPLPHSQQLHQWHRDSPLGHKPWLAPPAPAELDQTIAGAVDEAPPPADAVAADRLERLWDDLCATVTGVLAGHHPADRR